MTFRRFKWKQVFDPLNSGSVLLEPFRIAVMTLLYYDFRIRKEGFDLEIMAEELEADLEDDFSI